MHLSDRNVTRHPLARSGRALLHRFSPGFAFLALLQVYPALLAQSSPPQIGRQPSPQAAWVGSSESTQFEVGADGTPPLRYQWFKDGTPLAGRTQEIVSLTNVTLDQAGAYAVQVTNNYGSVTSTAATLTVRDFRIVTQPAAQVASPGASVTFSIEVFSTDPVSYQWHGENGRITGATGPALTLPNVQAADAGRYHVELSTAYAGKGSDRVTLTVTSAPVFTTPPRPQSVAAGGRATLAGFVIGMEPFSYQWFKDGAPVAGATNHQIVFAAAARSDEGPYTLRVSNSIGSITSEPVDLSVVSISIVGVRTKTYDGQPLSVSATTEPAGLAVSMRYTRTNGFAMTGPPVEPGTYYARATVSDMPYHGVVSAELRILAVTVAVTVRGLQQVYDGRPKLVRISIPQGDRIWPEYINVPQPLDAGIYPFRLRQDDTSLVSLEGPAEYTLVVEKTPQAVTFVALPASLAVGTAFSVQWTATSSLPVTLAVASGNATLSGTQLTLHDTAPVTLRATQAGDRNHQATSETLVLSAAKQTQAITFAPLADLLLSTTPVALSASASSGLPVGFEIVGGPATIAGSTLVFTGYEGVVTVRAIQSGNGSYNAAASVVRSFSVLTAQRPFITAQPVSRTVQLDQPASFSVGASAPGPLTYVWMHNGIPMTSSAPLGSSFTINRGTQASAGSYSVAVFHGGACTVTLAATLTVELAPNPAAVPPTISGISPSQALQVGDFIGLTTSTQGFGLYQWFKDGQLLPGATNSSFNGFYRKFADRRFIAADAGQYQLVMTNTAGSAMSPVTTLSVAPGYNELREPLIADGSSNAWTLVGGTVTLSVTAMGEGLTYRWHKGRNLIAGANGPALTLTNAQLADSGGYAVFVTNRWEFSSSFGFLVAVRTGTENGAPFSEISTTGGGGTGGGTGAAPAIIAQPSGGMFEFGSRVVLSVTADGTAPLTYEWRREGVPIAGATNATLVFPSIQPADASFYGVVVRNSFGSIEGSVRVQVGAEPPSNPPRPPAITTAPVAQTVTEGGTAILTVNVSGSQPLSFQWRKNGVPLGDGHNQVFTIANVRVSDAGNYEVTAVNPYGAVTSVRVALQVNPVTPVAPPAAGTWLEQSIGGATPAGSAAVIGERVSVRGGGADIWDVADSFFFRYQALNGDGEIIARVDSLQDTHAWAKAGVMIRESLAPGARNATAFVTPQFVATLQYRPLPNASTQSAGSQWLSGPRWLRLVRAGNQFTAYHSSDGTAWTQLGSVLLEMPANVLVGLAVTSHLNGTLATAEMDRVSLAGSAPPPPPPPPTTPPVLAAPSNLSATVMSATALTLNWTDNASVETAFDLQRSTDGTTFVSVALLGANVTLFAATGLNPATTYHYRVRAMQGATGSAFSNVGMATTSAAVTPTPPPAGDWQTLDVGGVAAAGSAAESGGTVTLRGSGADIWDSGDEFRYRYVAWNGDGEIVARLTHLDDAHAWAKAGLMFRESLTASARHVFMCVSSANGTALQSRSVAGGGSESISGSRSAAPRWVRLVRAGSTFTGYESADGVNWTQVGAVTLALPSALHLGLAVTSHNDGVLCTATFTQVTLAGGATPPPASPLAPSAPSQLAGTATSTSAIGLTWIVHASNETGFEIERSLDNVTFVASGTVAANATSATLSGLSASTAYYLRVRAVNGALTSAYSATVTVTTQSPPPPSGTTGTWESRDIGAVGASGSASESGGTVTLTGSGEDIWNNSDEFRYRYQSITGDGQITARVTGLTETHGWAKAGVMIRETLTGPSRHVLMGISATQGSVFQRRSSTGGGSDSTAGSLSSTLPGWVRLVRSGNLFSAYDSIDGSTWNLVGSATLALPATAFIGVAVTSHNDGVLCTATLGSVSITGGGIPPTPPPPTSPPPAATLPAPSGLTANAISSAEIQTS